MHVAVRWAVLVWLFGKKRCPIIDTWWQTETGGFMIVPAAGIALPPLKPGSATFPLPGVDADVVDEDGRPVPPDTRGYLVIKEAVAGHATRRVGRPEEVY